MKKRILAVLCLTALVCVGCGGSNKTELVTKKEETDKKSQDISEMFEKVEVGGVRLGFPFLVGDLPDGYTMDIRPDSKFEKCESFNIIKEGEKWNIIHKWISVSIKCDDVNKLDTAEVFSIDCTWMKNTERWADVTIDGIGVGSTIDEVLNRFGEPDQDNDISEMYPDRADEPGRYISYFGKEDEEIQFNSDDGEKINSICIWSEGLE